MYKIVFYVDNGLFCMPIDDKLEKVICQYIREGKHTQTEIAEKFGISPSSVASIQKKHGVVKKSIPDESHIEAQQASMDKIKQEMATVRKRELDRMKPTEVLEIFKRSEKQQRLVENYSRLEGIVRNMLDRHFPVGVVKPEYDKEDLMRLKIAEEILGKFHDRMIGNGEPLLPPEVDDNEKYGAPLPEKEYYGTGKIIEVEE